MNEEQQTSEVKPIGQVIPGWLRRKQEQTTARSEREEVVEQFRNKLNTGRVRDGFPELSPVRMSMMLSSYTKQITGASAKLHKLRVLWSECVDSDNRGFGFSKAFWVEMKRSKPLKQQTLI